MPFPIPKPTSTRNLINNMKYVPYLKNDPNQEAISTITDSYLQSIELAINYFSRLKRLDLDNFNKIYGVKDAQTKTTK